MKGADEYTLTKNAKTRTSEDICGHQHREHPGLDAARAELRRRSAVKCETGRMLRVLLTLVLAAAKPLLAGGIVSSAPLPANTIANGIQIDDAGNL
jgi:hypothetical protein